MPTTLTPVDEFYRDGSSSSQVRYFYIGGYAAGTRILFTMASGRYNWGAVGGSSITDSKGNIYSVIKFGNNAGSVAIVTGKLTTAVGVGDYIDVYPGGLPEGWVQVWTSDNDTGVTAISGGNAGGGALVDGITTPVSISQGSGSLANGGAVLGVMMMTRNAGAVTLTHGGSGETHNHEWAPPTPAWWCTESVWADTVPASTPTTYTQTGTANGTIYGWCALQVIIVGAVTPGTRGVRHTRTNTGRLLIADTQGGGTVLARRYSDGLIPAQLEAITLDSGTTDQASISIRANEWIDVVYSHNGAIKLKSSKNRGRTYGTVVTIAASGYRNPTHAWDKQRQRLVVVMQSTSNSNWYVTVLTQDGTNGFNTPSTPVQILFGTGNNAADLEWDPDNGFTLTYVNASSGTAFARCKNLSDTGTGTWS